MTGQIIDYLDHRHQILIAWNSILSRVIFFGNDYSLIGFGILDDLFNIKMEMRHLLIKVHTYFTI